jgi:hypothetical protein
LNKLPNEYFYDDKNFENIYLISDKTKLVEILIDIAQEKQRYSKMSLSLNLLDI